MKGTPLGEEILRQLAMMPQGAGYRFEPAARAGPLAPTNPRDPHHDGVARAIVHEGVVVARAAGDGATYCCGVTLEAWWRAVVATGGGPPPLTVREAEQLLVSWFCPRMGHPGAPRALAERGLGVEVTRADARRGDLVQFWRSVDLATPSGHSAVFLGWGRQGEHDTIRYRSSQPATGGVGDHEEIIGTDWTFAFGRPAPPDRFSRS